MRRIPPLFVYGSLLDASFASNLLERPVRSEPARLLDFELLRLQGFPYPTAFHAPGATIEGGLYRDLTDDDLVRLDAYEGVSDGLYQRVEAEVVATGEGREPSAESAYVYLVTEKTLRRYGML